MVLRALKDKISVFLHYLLPSIGSGAFGFCTDSISGSVSGAVLLHLLLLLQTLRDTLWPGENTPTDGAIRSLNSARARRSA